MLTVTLTIGVAVSILLSELTGLTAGGIIVPGYVALILDSPRALGGVFVLAALTFAAVRLLGLQLVLFGSRRFGLMVLLGLVLSTGAKLVRPGFDPLPLDWAGLGYVVPGLVAHHSDRQGIAPTVLMITIAAPMVRLLASFLVRWWV